jgi:hypothetical protein
MEFLKVVDVGKLFPADLLYSFKLVLENSVMEV